MFLAEEETSGLREALRQISWYCNAAVPMTSPTLLRTVCIPGWLRAYCVAEDNLEFLILLLLPAKYWEYRCMPSSPVYMVLGMESKVLGMLCKLSID